MLAGTDGIKFVETHQEVVSKSHFLIELIRQVEMVQEILPQRHGQQTLEERCLTTALCANQRRHTFIAVQGVHLQPMGNGRTQPNGEKIHLLSTDARQTPEETSHMIVSVPFWQRLQEVLDGVEVRDFLRLYIFYYVRLRIALNDLLNLSTDDDAIERLRG